MSDPATVAPTHVPISEYIVLFGILAFAELMRDAANALPSAVAFWSARNRRLYETMLSLHAAGKVVDYGSIVGEVKVEVDSHQTTRAIDCLAVLSGSELPASWWVNPSSPAFLDAWRSHLKQVSETHALRQINEHLKSGNTSEVAEMIAELHKSGTAQLLTMEQMIEYAYSQLELVEEATIPYPFGCVQRATGGIERAGVIVVAARPSVGKSSFIQDIAIHALRESKAVLFVSGEMPVKMLIERVQSALIGQDLRSMRLSGHEAYKQEQLRGMGEMTDLPGHLTTYYTSTTADIEALVRKHQGAYDLVVVDYLQLFTPRRPARTDYERVTAVSTELTTMARSFNLPFVIAAQINREGDAVQPNMSDIKGSGQIEQDADIILTLWRDPEDRNQGHCRPVRIDLLKNRNGATFRNSKSRQYRLLLEEGLYRFRDE